MMEALEKCPICGSDPEITTIDTYYNDPMHHLHISSMLLPNIVDEPPEKRAIECIIKCRGCDSGMSHHQNGNYSPVAPEKVEEVRVKRADQLISRWNSRAVYFSNNNHPHFECEYAWTKIVRGEFDTENMFYNTDYIRKNHFCGLIPMDKIISQEKPLCSEFLKSKIIKGGKK